jgi:hypothetical protein
MKVLWLKMEIRFLLNEFTPNGVQRTFARFHGSAKATDSVGIIDVWNIVSLLADDLSGARNQETTSVMMANFSHGWRIHDQ